MMMDGYIYRLIYAQRGPKMPNHLRVLVSMITGGPKTE